ncbi:hypothetical protein OHA71_38125 [Streptomyces sp. NBC_00444]|uniref:hypothetical protein n=1 Tax=Streptomyces sp. NBC_00444 TaxID=2975744 RepID=UPI002E24D734
MALGSAPSLALIGTTWQARIAAGSKRQELNQSKEQARTQLYVDHVGRRLKNRRATYIAFMQAASTLVQATRDDRIDGARLTGQILQHLAEMAEAAGEIDTARNTVMIDGPQAVAGQAAELCRIPYRLASAVSAIYDDSLDDDGRQQALQAAVDIRVNLVRELTRFSVMASVALNLDGVGNHLDNFQTPGAVPSAT